MRLTGSGIESESCGLVATQAVFAGDDTDVEPSISGR